MIKNSIKFQPIWNQKDTAPIVSNWFAKFDLIIEKNLKNNDLSNGYLTETLGITQVELISRVRAATGMTPGQYIRARRLDKAMDLLTSGTYQTAKQTCYAVGYGKPDCFSKKFEERFGKKPFDVLKEYGWR